MAYAIRFMTPTDGGMLVEWPAREAKNIKARQDAADEAREAYWDTPDEARPAGPPPPETFPYYEFISAYEAHNWVRKSFPHSTPLYTVDGGKIRRASDPA